MIRKPAESCDQATEDEKPRAGESFLQRFNRRKLEARSKAAGSATEPTERVDGVAEAPGESPPEESTRELTDADMPPLESLDESSDYRGFLSEKVSESLRRAALRKLFHSSAFNVIDELDEYAEDFTTFEALGDIVTSDMRHQIEVEARRKAEALKQAMLDDTDAEAENESEATSVETSNGDTGTTAIDSDVLADQQIADTRTNRTPVLSDIDDSASQLTQARPPQEDPHVD